MATAYTNPCGSGDRRTLVLVSAAGTGTPSLALGGLLVNGNTTDNAFFFAPGSTGNTIEFWFPSRKIIDEAKFYQSLTTAHGTWQWQGSNDRATWTAIGGTFTLGGVATQTLTTLAGNVTGYIFYRLAQVSGTASSSPWVHEFEFKVDEAGTTSYVNPLGSGNRTATIVTTSSGIVWAGAGITALVNGLYTNQSWWDSTANAGVWVQFDLGVTCVVQQARFWFDQSINHGGWKLQGSLDAAAWTDLTGVVTLGTTASPGPFVTCFTGAESNTTAYRYYRLLGVSGTRSSSSYDIEVEFMVSGGAAEPLTARVTQAVIETLSHPTPEGRVTQAVVEMLASSTSSTLEARVTQAVVETLTASPEPDGLVTQLVAETLTKVAPSPIRVSQAPAETVQAFDASLVEGRVSQAPLETVQQFAPSRAAARVTQAPLEILYPFGCYPVGQCCHADYPRLPLDCRDGYPLIPPDGPDLYPILPAEDCMDASTFVVNMALAEIGITKTIASLSGDASQEGDAARLVFSDVMDTVLRDHPWKFATEYAALLWDGGSPAAPVNPDWVYAYKLPDDCVRVRRVCDPSQQRRYSVTPIPFDQRATFDGDKDLLLCNEPGAGLLPPLAVGVPVTLTIEYTKRFTCPAQVNDAQFREAVVFKLAARLAKALARDSKDADRCLRNYTMALPKAQTQHANQSEPQRPVDDVPDWTKGR